MQTNSPHCFHCGLPVTDAQPPALEVEGQVRTFCCTGCRAVCEAICASGHADYYRFREAPAGRAAEDVLPDVLSHVELYDRDDIQQGFVRQGRHWKEAALILEEIRCAACLWLNEQHLRSLDGVLDVQMDYTSHRARVRWDPARIRLSEILKAIASIGYVAYPYDTTHSEQIEAARRRRNLERILFAGAVGMPVMQFSVTSYIMGHPDSAGVLPLWVVIGRWTSLAATAAILAYSGQDFFVSAWRELRQRRLGMDVPIVIGLLVAWLGSLHATVMRSGEVYYDSIAMFVFLVLVARHLELRARLVASASLDRMAKLIPRVAHRVDEDGEHDVPVADLRPGDRLRVRPGEAVPLDGELVRGQSHFDESLLTGESMPVAKGPGQPVLGGSINGDQPVEIVARRRSDDSLVSEIQRLVERGLNSRPRVAALADRAAAAFVAVILAVATGTTLAWAWLDPGQLIHNLVAVLIVTCPCALALATPVAVTLGAARLAEAGVLPLRMRAIEALASATVLACDKTGTLTAGDPCVGTLEVQLPELDADRALHIAASLEQGSEHPFARAFRKACRTRHLLPVEDARNEPGVGVRGCIGGRCWWLGTPDAAPRGAHADPDLEARIQALRAAGESVVLLACEDGRPAALFGVVDPPRPGLDTLIAGVRDSGVRRILILSGDHRDNVARLAGALEVDAYAGGLSPAQKLDWIRREQAVGRQVIMLGDGFNDAPTLAAADASLSFGAATDAAKISSDFLITGTSLESVPVARGLARRTHRVILQNLSWAAAYNLGAVPLAAMGFVPPWAAAIGMSMSSLLVVVNALRLRDGGTPRTASARTMPLGRAAQGPA